MLHAVGSVRLVARVSTVCMRFSSGSRIAPLVWLSEDVAEVRVLVVASACAAVGLRPVLAFAPRH